MTERKAWAALAGLVVFLAGMLLAIELGVPSSSTDPSDAVYVGATGMYRGHVVWRYSVTPGRVALDTAGADTVILTSEPYTPPPVVEEPPSEPITPKLVIDWAFACFLSLVCLSLALFLLAALFCVAALGVDELQRRYA